MIDLDLFKDKELTETLKLIITPINVLSIADKTNGSYIDTNGIISDNKIYGLLENVLEFHFGTELRNELFKDKKTFGMKLKTPDQIQKLQYFPIIHNICKIINKQKLENYKTFIDAFSNLSTHDDIRHLNGSKIRDKSINNNHITTYLNSLFTKNTDKTLNDINNLNIIKKFPQYYTTIFKRKYIYIEQNIEIIIKTNKELSKLLFNKTEINNSAYLGNSDSIINLKIEKIC